MDEQSRQGKKGLKKEKFERVSKRDPRATKEALLKAAGEVLVEQGLYGFHIHDIARRAGFGKPLLYRYFGDRTQVLNALVEAKVKEVQKIIESAKAPKGAAISNPIFKQIVFARLLASDAVLQWLFRAVLCNELEPAFSKKLDGLFPHPGGSGDKAAAEAFLLAGISYVLLLRPSQPVCAGVPIETPNDLAVFERAFVSLIQKV